MSDKDKHITLGIPNNLSSGEVSLNDELRKQTTRHKLILIASNTPTTTQQAIIDGLKQQGHEIEIRTEQVVPPTTCLIESPDINDFPITQTTKAVFFHKEKRGKHRTHKHKYRR